MSVLPIKILIYILAMPFMAEKNINGVYLGSKGEFLCFDGTNFSYRFYNNDALATYRIGLGDVIDKRSNSYKLINSKKLKSKTAITKKNRTIGLVDQIQVLHLDGSPVLYCKVFISQINSSKTLFSGITDKSGVLSLQEFYNNHRLDSQILTITITDLSFETVQEIELQLGYSYVIQCLIPDKYPFIPIKSFIKFKKIWQNSDTLIIKPDLMNKKIFVRDRALDSCSCGELLFKLL